jgi:hypothetical protein
MRKVCKQKIRKRGLSAGSVLQMAQLFNLSYSYAVSIRDIRGHLGTIPSIVTFYVWMGQHGQRFNTGTCFSVFSDDKLVLFLFPWIPTGDPAIVAFYDKRFYKKLRLKELSLSDPLYHGKKQHWNMTK